MRTALCVIGRLENRYAPEFVSWYRKLGFTKIFVYDNNHGDEEHFEDVLQDDIDNGFVDVVDFRDKEVAQLHAYNDCYSKHKDEFDWFAFFDFDEFLVLTEGITIEEFLSRFECDVVKINWMLYTDNGLLSDDGRALNERFTEPMAYDKPIKFSFPENNHVKSIVRGGIHGTLWTSTPHTPSLDLKFMTADGGNGRKSPFQPYSFDTAYLKHFSTKTIEEYIQNKMVRGVGDRSARTFKSTYNFDWFFKINERTPEKEEIINKYLEAQ